MNGFPVSLLAGVPQLASEASFFRACHGTKQQLAAHLTKDVRVGLYILYSLLIDVLL